LAVGVGSASTAAAEIRCAWVVKGLPGAYRRCMKLLAYIKERRRAKTQRKADGASSHSHDAQRAAAEQVRKTLEKGGMSGDGGW
jgi:hypothetical protein